MILEDKFADKKKSSFGEKLPRVVGISAVLIAIGGGAGIFFGNDYFKTRVLKNPSATEIKIIEKGATYSGHASKLIQKYPCIREAGLNRTTDYLKHELNDGRPLRAGENITLPVYSCPK